jgi:hypothetical protein
VDRCETAVGRADYAVAATLPDEPLPEPVAGLDEVLPDFGAGSPEPDPEPERELELELELEPDPEAEPESGLEPDPADEPGEDDDEAADAALLASARLSVR